LTKSERISDEKIGNIGFDGVHEVETALSRLDSESLEDTEDGRTSTERDRLDGHATSLNLRNVEDVVDDQE
jgi:hypothetical protein